MRKREGATRLIPSGSPVFVIIRHHLSGTQNGTWPRTDELFVTFFLGIYVHFERIFNLSFLKRSYRDGWYTTYNGLFRFNISIVIVDCVESRSHPSV